MTGSFNPCDRPGKTGWGKLMCNTPLCPNGYCQGTTEQGICCISRHSRHSYAQQIKATCVSVLMCCRYNQKTLPWWRKLNLLSNCFPVLQPSHTRSMLGLADCSSEVHVEPELWSVFLNTEARVFPYSDRFLFSSGKHVLICIREAEMMLFPLLCLSLKTYFLRTEKDVM